MSGRIRPYSKSDQKENGATDMHEFLGNSSKCNMVNCWLEVELYLIPLEMRTFLLTIKRNDFTTIGNIRHSIFSARLLSQQQPESSKLISCFIASNYPDRSYILYIGSLPRNQTENYNPIEELSKKKKIIKIGSLLKLQ